MSQPTEQLTYEGVATPTPEPWSTHQQGLVRALSHEIRSILASAKICAEALGEPHPPAEDIRRRYATVVAEQVDHIARLLDDFIAVMNYDSDNEALPPSLVDINATVWEAAHQLYSLTQQRSVSLRLVPSASPSIVKGSNARLTQALRGCLEHTLQATPEGSDIQVTVEHIADRSGQPAIAVRIECTQVPQGSRRLRLVSSSAWDTVTLRAVQHITDAHRGYIEVLGDGHDGLCMILPRCRAMAAGQLPASGQWRAQSQSDVALPQAQAMGL